MTYIRTAACTSVDPSNAMHRFAFEHGQRYIRHAGQ
jgi:hypothetical protein